MAERDLIYLDNAATTAVDPRVLEAMLPYFTEQFGNPSSVHRTGIQARRALDISRRSVAEGLGASPEEIIFTSCGTESDNLALRGVAWACEQRGRHLITTPIEHHAVGNTLAQLQSRFGFQVTEVPVDHDGLVDPDDVGRALRDDTTLVSVMLANNEVGTIEPLEEISRIVHARGALLHTDAVQAVGHVPIDVDALGVDLLSLSGHKLHAPKGVGALYVRRGTPLLAMQTGGGQEMHLRSGTENLPYIVGLARAIELATQERQVLKRVQQLRDRLVEGVLKEIPDVELTGHPTRRLPNNASFVLMGIDGESLVMQLTTSGVAASTGSACSAGSGGASHVLTAMGYQDPWVRGSLRLSLSRYTTEDEVDRAIAILSTGVKRLRSLSPLYAQRGAA
ncbi:MAG: cysteine desulfurase family protein [Anaerolineae bacterium]|jgi:cysteine desulfurase|nr:cysteine desulfurase [Chloroflexota bacterium]